MNVESLIDEVIAIEGGYSNHPADRGGPTNWGVTQAVARQHGYDGDMRAFPRAEAVHIYKRLYWLKPGFHIVATFAPHLAAEMFDTGINMGTGVASGFLQRALNALNRNGQDYKDITVDRQVGPQTQAALEAFLKKRGSKGERVLIKAMEALQGERYIRLAEKRSKNEAFLFGWLSNRVQLG